MVRETFAVPREFDNMKTKKKLLNHLINFRATTFTEAINKEDSIRFEKEQNKRLQEMLDAQQEHYDEMESYESTRIKEMREHNEKLLEEQRKQREEANRRAAALERDMREKMDRINETIKTNSNDNYSHDNSYYHDDGITESDVRNAVHDAVQDALKNL